MSKPLIVVILIIFLSINLFISNMSDDDYESYDIVEEIPEEVKEESPSNVASLTGASEQLAKSIENILIIGIICTVMGAVFIGFMRPFRSAF